MKKMKLIMLPLLLASSLFAEPFFSGNTAFAGKYTNQKPRTFDPTLNIDGYVSCQFDISNSFLVRGEFSIQTENLYDDFYSETDSVFRIDELSCTFIKPFHGITHMASLFLGTFEPIGNQNFLQHSFGIESFSSLLTANYLGLNGCNVYDFYGWGGAYSFVFKTVPVAGGILIYKNNNNENEDAQLNSDIRFGTVTKYFTLDCTVGIGAPMNTKNSKGEDVVVMIEKLFLHTGIDLLLGKKDGTSLLCQMGFDNLPVKCGEGEEKKMPAKDLYLLIEPKLDFNAIKITGTFWNMPADKYEKTILIEDPVGYAACIYSDKISVGNRNMTLGIHGSLSFEGKDIKDLNDDDLMDVKNVKIMPFMFMDFMGGRLDATAQLNITRLNNRKEKPFNLSLGYKHSL